MIGQLISIKSVPVFVEIVIENAKLSYNSQLPKVEMTREKGGLQMKADPIRVNIDTLEMRKSIGMKPNGTLIKDFADEGFRINYQGIARVVKEGNELADPNGMKPGDIAASRLTKSIETVLDFIPKDGPDISWDGGKLSIHYQMDKLNMDWDVGKVDNFEFIPGKVKIQIKQMPSVDIEYLGSPIYVPPSAAPDFSGNKIDVKA